MFVLATYENLLDMNISKLNVHLIATFEIQLKREILIWTKWLNKFGGIARIFLHGRREKDCV